MPVSGWGHLASAVHKKACQSVVGVNWPHLDLWNLNGNGKSASSIYPLMANDLTCPSPDVSPSHGSVVGVGSVVGMGVRSVVGMGVRSVVGVGVRSVVGVGVRSVVGVRVRSASTTLTRVHVINVWGIVARDTLSVRKRFISATD